MANLVKLLDKTAGVKQRAEIIKKHIAKVQGELGLEGETVLEIEVARGIQVGDKVNVQTGEKSYATGWVSYFVAKRNGNGPYGVIPVVLSKEGNYVQPYNHSFPQKVGH